MSLRSDFIDALRHRYEADVLLAKSNIQVYIDNAAGIGEHSNIAEALDEQFERLSSAEDKLKVLDKYFSVENPLARPKR